MVVCKFLFVRYTFAVTVCPLRNFVSTSKLCPLRNFLFTPKLCVHAVTLCPPQTACTAKLSSHPEILCTLRSFCVHSVTFMCTPCRFIHSLRNFCVHPLTLWGTRWRIWLGYCVTSRKVAGSIPYGVIGIFRELNPSGRIMTLGWTQSLTEMITRDICSG